MKLIATLEIKKALNTEKLVIAGLFFLFLLVIGLVEGPNGGLIFLSVIIFALGVLPEFIAYFWQESVTLGLDENNMFYAFEKNDAFRCKVEKIDSIWIEVNSINGFPTSAKLKVYVWQDNSLLGNEYIMLSLYGIFKVNKIKSKEIYRIYNFLRQYNDKVRLTAY